MNQQIKSRLEDAARSSGVLPDQIDKAVEAAMPAFTIDSLGFVVPRDYQAYRSAEDYFSGPFKHSNAAFFSRGGTVKRAEFDQMSQIDRTVFMRAGGKVVD